MRVICAKSATEFVVPGFVRMTPQPKITGEHPLISAPIVTLLKVHAEYLQGKLNELESRILFVSFLNYSGLVEFEAAAVPDMVTIANNMQRLVTTVDWANNRMTAFSLPRYKVTRFNANLRNIGVWLHAWNLAKARWYLGREAEVERTAQLIREDILNKLIRSTLKKSEDYAAKLGRWSLIASDAPHQLHTFWLSLFTLKEPAIWNARTADLEELLDHMLEHLDVGNSSVAQAVVQHVQKLLTKNKKGIMYGLDLFDEEEVAFIDMREDRPYRFKSKEERLLESLITDAPERKPEAGDVAFAGNKLAFLIATAKWNKVLELKELILKQEQAQKAEKLLLEKNEAEMQMEGISDGGEEDWSEASVMSAEEYDIERLLGSEALKPRSIASGSNGIDKIEEI